MGRPGRERKTNLFVSILTTSPFLQENQKLRMEYELLKMENENLKLDLGKYIYASQKRRGDGHDSGDFNHFSETSVDAEGRVSGLLGSLEVPFLVNEEVLIREDRMKTYFRNKLTQLQFEKEKLGSKCEHYAKEVSVAWCGKEFKKPNLQTFHQSKGCIFFQCFNFFCLYLFFFI